MFWKRSRINGAELKLRIESLTEHFQDFKIKRVEQTLKNNLIEISFMFFPENEPKISISYHLSENSYLTEKNK